MAAISAAGGSPALEIALDYCPPRSRLRALACASSDADDSTNAIIRSSWLSPQENPAAKVSVAVGDTLSLKLFDDQTIRVKLLSSCGTQSGCPAFLGEAEGYEGVRNVVVLQTEDGLQVDVRDFKRGQAYKITSSADGVTVRELRPSAHGRRVRELAQAPATVRNRARQVRLEDASGGSVHVDVLVACDLGAKRWIERSGSVRTFAEMAVLRMNAALANTGLDQLFSFRLVGTVEVPADGGDDFDGVLDAVSDGIGIWAAVGEKRDAVGADVVTVLIDTGSYVGTTGLGYALQRESDISEFSELAYNVCAVRAVDSDHTMTHEVGHHMGAGHGDRQMSSPGPQLYRYSAGYYFNTGNERYHTIMAYNFDGFGNTYEEAPYFSSPLHRFQGVPVGTTDRNDNTRTIQQTYRWIAAFRSEVGIPPPQDDPSPEDPPHEDPPQDEPSPEDPPPENPPHEYPPHEYPPQDDPSPENPPQDDPSPENPPQDDPSLEDPPVVGEVTASWNGFTGYVRILWTPVSWASDYIVFRSAERRLDSAERLVTTRNCFFYDSTAIPGVVYWYLICPRKANGISSDKEFSFVRGMRAVETSQPQASVNAYAGYVKVTWPKIEGAANYAIFRSTKPTFSWQTTSRIVITGNEFYYDQPSNTNPKPGQRYYYWIGTYTPLFTYVEERKFASGIRALDVPVPTVTTMGNGIVGLKWDGVVGARDYAVFRSETSTFDWRVEKRLAIVSGNSYQDCTVPRGVRVFYWICPRTEEFTYNKASAYVEAYCPIEDFKK